MHDTETLKLETNFSVPNVIKEALANLPDIHIDSINTKGANGYIFLGQHNIFNRRVALKFYYFGDDYHDEVRVIKDLKHKNIINIWDARTVGDGWAYFLTDEANLGDLENIIATPSIGLKHKIKIIREVLEGVVELHKSTNSILHRDLKPANILCTFDYTPLIADFGSFKYLPQNQTHVNSCMNTILYNSPENFNNHHHAQSDIYQIGVILYQLMGGTLIYDGLKYLNLSDKKKYDKLTSDFDRSKLIDKCIENRITKNKLLKYNTIPLFVPSKIIKIIRTATSPDLTKRYKSASEMLLDFHKIINIPDWSINNNNEIFLNQWKGRDYRVLKVKNKFICEKRTCNTCSWRKDSTYGEGEESGIIINLKKLLIKK